MPPESSRAFPCENRDACLRTTHELSYSVRKKRKSRKKADSCLHNELTTGCEGMCLSFRRRQLEREREDDVDPLLHASWICLVAISSKLPQLSLFQQTLETQRPQHVLLLPSPAGAGVCDSSGGSQEGDRRRGRREQSCRRIMKEGRRQKGILWTRNPSSRETRCRPIIREE